MKYSGLLAGLCIACIIGAVFSGNMGATLGFFSSLTYEIRLYLHERP